MPKLRTLRWLLSALLSALGVAAAQEPVFTGPCTRRTSIVLSEIHYHPAGEDLANTSFIELYNSSPISVDLSGWKLRGDADFDIPEGTRLGGGRFLVLAADPEALRAAGVTADVAGPWTGELSNKAGTVRLRKKSGGIVLETDYEDESPWPLAADGAGHSLVLAHPAIGESRPEAWAASSEHGGSPGAPDPEPGATALDRIVISEVLANAGPGEEEFVEIYNPGPGTADLSGCFLTRDRDLPGTAIAEGTTLAAGAYASFSATTGGFDFDATGDSIYLRAPDGLKVLAARKFGGQETGHSWGGIGDWHERTTPTPGAANSARFQRPVVINEIHYHPAAGDNSDEFIELHNTGDTAVDLSGWEIKGGIGYPFPEGTTITAGGFLVVTHGEFGGSLSNAGERVALEMPGNILADEVAYFDGGRWPKAADGGGTSLQLVDPRADNALAPNWRAGDESGRAVTVTVEHTGVTDLGHPKAPSATRAFAMLLGEGEAVIDDFEVLVDGENRVRNGNFADGIVGWRAFGTHQPSFAGDGALHLVARDGGGDVANLVETSLSSRIPEGTTVTIRAKCRWVSGTPQILLGLNGGWLEAPETLPVPGNAGTPGAENFGGATNAGPAITGVSHSPLLPEPGEPITVTAHIDDPDGVLAARIRYRIDPETSVSQITMTDDGQGTFTGTIPGQPNRTLVAFNILVADDSEERVASTFPADVPERECLVMVGEADEPGAFSTMHLWLTDENHDEWRRRERSSNLDLDMTFVSEGRVYYNCGVHYAGSPNGVTIYDSPTGNPTGYNVEFPADQFFLNTQKLTLDRETTRDDTRQRERMLFWFLEKLGLPNLHRRYVHVFLNGVERDQLIIEDVQKPNREIIDQWFAGEGRLTKTNPWFEYDPSGTIILEAGSSVGNRLERFEHGDGSPWRTRDRWTWSPAAGHDDPHDFTSLDALIEAVQPRGSRTLEAVRERVDIRQWMRTFAANDLGSYWDTFGNPGSKNAYLFESFETGLWSVVVWDMDVGLGVFNDPFNAALFPGNVDPAIERLYAEPAFVRDYWGALSEALDTFFESGQGTEVDRILGETFEALTANGAAVTSPFVPSGPEGLSVDRWIERRRTFLQGEIAGMDAGFAATGPATSTELFTTVTGTAPLTTETITANGVGLEIAWTSITDWSANVPLGPGTNTVEIVASDRHGTPTGTTTLAIEYTGTATWPALRINEWMASNPEGSGILDPADGKAEDWFELFNPTDAAVSLEGWFLGDREDDLQEFRIPAGFAVPANGFVLVWADDEVAQNDPAVRQEIHAAFKLGSGGESIFLSAPDGSLVDQVDFGDQTPGVTRRRFPDGGGVFDFSLSPTPGASNPAAPPAAAATGLDPSVSGNTFSLGFDSFSGTIYQLQTSPDLITWTAQGAPLAGDGTSQSFSLDAPDGTRFFVRIQSF